MKSSKFSRIVLASLAALMVTGTAPAFADSSPEDIQRFVQMCDVNKDGMVSKTELMKRAEAMLAKMPASKEGMVDSKKALAFIMELQKSDGGLGYMTSKSDFMKKMDAAFDKYDTTKAGMLNKQQFEAFVKELTKVSGA
jgi:Ca2+-binding EF-hand superfamily protein